MVLNLGALLEVTSERHLVTAGFFFFFFPISFVSVQGQFGSVQLLSRVRLFATP